MPAAALPIARLLHEAAPGPVTLPTGRTVYWTGRVAIGLRHQPAPSAPADGSQAWLQAQLLGTPRRRLNTDDIVALACVAIGGVAIGNGWVF